MRWNISLFDDMEYLRWAFPTRCGSFPSDFDYGRLPTKVKELTSRERLGAAIRGRYDLCLLRREPALCRRMAKG
jgi:hypothetical protein